jgi:hypothetical protein
MSAIPPVLAPVHQPDLRPVADAVAVRREVVPELPVGGPSVPASLGAPSVAIVAEVGRSLLAAEALAAEAGEGEGERRLKPWGVAMLPHEARGEAADARRDEPTGV